MRDPDFKLTEARNDANDSRPLPLKRRSLLAFAASAPVATTAVGLLGTPTQAEALPLLHAQGIKTLAALTIRIPRRRRWWASIPGLGATGARHVEAFFAAHPELTERARALVETSSPQRIGSWESLRPPEEIDGSQGYLPGASGELRAQRQQRLSGSSDLALDARVAGDAGRLPQGG